MADNYVAFFDDLSLHLCMSHTVTQTEITKSNTVTVLFSLMQKQYFKQKPCLICLIFTVGQWKLALVIDSVCCNGNRKVHNKYP